MPYIVTWEIEIDADSPEEAAREALEIQRDPASCATVFDVEFWSEGSHPCGKQRIDAAFIPSPE